MSSCSLHHLLFVLQVELNSRVRGLRSSGKAYNRLSTLTGAPANVDRRRAKSITAHKVNQDKDAVKLFSANPCSLSYRLALPIRIIEKLPMVRPGCWTSTTSCACFCPFHILCRSTYRHINNPTTLLLYVNNQIESPDKNP